ncbi:MAG: prephenate dehydratase domain-containing protein [Candidatus Campbellbacteria bacterium]|nr:prephenate dehydratase domain-containing protein [Candidatus Campbellbacteria bacterium]
MENNKDSEKLVIGIQGGPGSFNEEAAHWYAKGHRIPNYELSYCYTTDKVLALLAEHKIDRGIFAIQNSVGGMVDESIYAMGRQLFEIVDQFEIIVNHNLLVLPGIEMDGIVTIMSHPQALAQCKSTLSLQYPDKNLRSGEGELIDQAMAAKALSEGQLPETTAVLASQAAADLYELNILDRGLQDKTENYTTFLFVSNLKPE